ncbi:MAG TPA: alkaline phosphatase family protein [Candidatus Koribacter sp.]|jgi:phospholipase C
MHRVIRPRAIARLLTLFVVLFGAASLFAQCTLNTQNQTVTICTPANGASVTSPVNVVAGTTDSNTVKYIQIYVDGTRVYTVDASSLNTNVTMTTGTHRVTVQAADSTGTVFKSTINITVTSGGGGGCSGSGNQTVTICSPANGATVTSPVNVVAGATDSNTVSYLQIYLDHVKVYQVSGKSMNTSLSMSTGTHRLTVQAKDSTGKVFNSTVNITVSSGGGGGGDITQVKHIIFFVQENRSTDNYFGVYPAWRSSHGFSGTFNGLPSNVSLPDYKGTGNVSPYHWQTACTETLSPGWNESHYDVDSGKMDRFMKTSGSTPSTIDPEGTRAMGYYDDTDLPYLYELASQYATSDTWYSPLLSNTIPNRMYLFAGTSFGHIRPDSPPSGGWTQPTIFRNLSQHGITWRYYYQDNSVFLASFSDWTAYQGHVYNISSYYNDIKNPSTLPEVIFIERASQTNLDEHPNANTQKGAADAANIINAFLQSPAYANSVFILTYDEGGGQYDHVAPFTEVVPDSIAPMLKSGDISAQFNQSGFRVPLVVISPWTKPHFISHVNRDSTAILKFIETRFSLPAMTKRDAAQDNMEEFFDFSSVQIPTPPTLPVQPTSVTCNKNLEKAPGY